MRQNLLSFFALSFQYKRETVYTPWVSSSPISANSRYILLLFRPVSYIWTFLNKTSPMTVISIPHFSHTTRICCLIFGTQLVGIRQKKKKMLLHFYFVVLQSCPDVISTPELSQWLQIKNSLLFWHSRYWLDSVCHKSILNLVLHFVCGFVCLAFFVSVFFSVFTSFPSNSSALCVTCFFLPQRKSQLRF